MPLTHVSGYNIRPLMIAQNSTVANSHQFDISVLTPQEYSESTPVRIKRHNRSNSMSVCACCIAGNVLSQDPWSKCIFMRTLINTTIYARTLTRAQLPRNSHFLPSMCGKHGVRGREVVRLKTSDFMAVAALIRVTAIVGIVVNTVASVELLNDPVLARCAANEEMITNHFNACKWPTVWSAKILSSVSIACDLVAMHVSRLTLRIWSACKSVIKCCKLSERVFVYKSSVYIEHPTESADVHRP